MRRRWRFFPAALFLCQLYVPLTAPCLTAQDSQIMGEVKLEGATKVEKYAGVWVDGTYVGYVKELKGKKKLLLLPGKHEITVRQSGYGDFGQDVVVEPGQVQTLSVKMSRLPGAQAPAVTAELKLTVEPKRAAVFLDDNFIGHAGSMGGAFHTLLISPGKHRIKIELPGYRSFETEVNLLAGQKSELKTGLVKGSIEQASSHIKESQ